MTQEARRAALFIAPMGRDAAILQRLLEAVHIPCSPCRSVEELTSRLSQDTTFVIATEEVLNSANLQAVAAWIEAQPSWSDLPFIVLIGRGSGAERNPLASRLAAILGNVSFLERPFHPTTLISLALTALRGRQRQYEARVHLQELEKGRDELRESEARFRATFENAAIGIGHVAPDGSWLRVNRRLCEIVGYSDAELRTKTFQEITHPDDLADDLAHVERVLRREINEYGMEKRYFRKDGSIIWINLTVGSVCRPDNAVDYLVAAIEDITTRKRQDDQIQLLMREVNHRSKNMLAVVQSIANQTARDSSPREFAVDFMQRLKGLSASQDLLIDRNWTSVGLTDLVQSQLAYLGSPKNERVRVRGQPILVTPSAAQGIGLALHELATNALKYGALSGDRGGVMIDWWRDGPEEAPRFHIAWTERGGPEVQEPLHRGFGRTVIERMSAIAVSGKVELRYDSEGLAWKLSAPEENVVYRVR